MARAGDYQPILVWMLPTNQPGGLETLVLEAAFDKWPNIRQPVDTFLRNTAASGWQIGKQSKMQLQSVIAATCEGRPDCGFGGHWHESPQFHIPLEHHVFDELEQFLRGFGALIRA